MTCRRTSWIAAATLIVLIGGGRLSAGPVLEERYRQLPEQTKQSLEELSIMNKASLTAIREATSADQLRTLVNEILDSGKLCVGARDAARLREAMKRHEASGNPDDLRTGIHRYLYDRFTAMPGVEYIGSLRGRAVVPVRVDNRLDATLNEPPSSLTVNGKTWRVTPLWPNGPMPSLCPTDGINGKLVYVDQARWEDVRGLELRDAICLMTFEGGRSFERLFSLGARAVVVIEDDQITRETAEGLFCQTPLPTPRFYIPRDRLVQDGVNLLDLAERKVFVEGQARVADGAKATLTGGHVYERRPFESLFFYLPPTKPITYQVQDDDLLQRIAQQYGTTADQLRRDNPNLPLTSLPVGTEIRILVKRETYSVKDDDLIERIAAQFGVKKQAIRQANNLTPDAELPTDKPITIPNVEETIFISLPIDSVSVAPDEPHGAQTATNLAVLIKMMELLAGEDDGLSIPRRKGVMVALLDAEHVGGLSSRTFAEYVLLNQDKLGGLDDGDEFSWWNLTFGIHIGLLLGAGLGWMLSMGDPDSPRRADQRILPMIITAACFAVVAGLITVAPSIDFLRREVDQLQPEQRVELYREVDAWMKSPETQTLSERAAKWFAEDWLTRRLERARTDAAEAATVIARKQGKLREENDHYRALEKELQEAEALTVRIADLRSGTLDQRGVSWVERATSFWNLLRAKSAGKEGGLPVPELHVDKLMHRFRMERSEEEERQTDHVNNLKVVKSILSKAHPGAKPDKFGVVLGNPTPGWTFSIADGSRSLGLFSEAKEFRKINYPAKSLGKQFNKRFREVVAVMAHRGEWADDWTFLTDADAVEFPVEKTKEVLNYSEFWSAGSIGMLPLLTQNDDRIKLDTPWDVPSKTEFSNLAVQARHVVGLMCLGVENPLDSLASDNLPQGSFSRLTGKVLRFNARSGIDAQETVPNVLIYDPLMYKKGEEGDAHNTAATLGARRALIEISMLNGQYTMPVESAAYNKKHGKAAVYAYRLDRDRALIDMVVDQGRIGTQKKTPDYKLVADADVEKDLIVTRVYPFVFFPGPDPMDYKIIGDNREQQDIRVVDAAVKGEPAHYALDNPAQQYGEAELDGNVLYMPAGRRARILVEKAATYKMLLIGDLVPEELADQLTRLARSAPTLEEIDFTEPPEGWAGPITTEVARDLVREAIREYPDSAKYRTVEARPKGRGYLVGPKENGDPNVFLSNTAMHVAADAYANASQRQQQFASRNLVDHSVDEALGRVEEKLAASRAAAAEHDWRAANGNAREGWGMLVKALPRILKLGREAVFSAIILMALLVPAAAFLERLLIGSKGIIAKIIGTVVIFVLAMVFLQFTHPALLIAVSPFIVMVAFVMILMAMIVLTISYQRFDVLVRRARASAGEVESEEISLLASLSTALSLGVSNLKKRPTRTFLTAMTVSVLTFSIITFVSVKGRDALNQREVTLEREIEDRSVEPIPPQYEGVLVREFHWHKLDTNFVSAIRSEFGADFDLTVRGFWIEAEGGNNADREGTNQIAIRRVPASHVAKEGDTWASIAEARGVTVDELKKANKVSGDQPPKAGQPIEIPAPRTPFIATAMMGFEPNEPDFSGINRAVTNNQWFRAEDPTTDPPTPPDRYKIILPDVAAKTLGIEPGDIYDGTPEAIASGQAALKPDDQLPVVSMQNLRWKVIGILDTKQADRYRDLTGKSLAIVDFLKSAFENNTQGDVANETPSYSMSWDKLVIVPMAVAERVKIEPRSVAIRFADKPQAEIDRFRRDLELRLNKTMFASFDENLAIVTTESQSSVGGLAKIIVPVLLCVLIVLNTMMGAVDERKGEVSMLGAIGLSPNQISFLLLSESMVFSVLGIVFGTLAGLLFAWLVPSFNHVFNTQVLSELSFNFTSVMSMFLAMMTGVVVLMSTLIPAKKAAALAAPSGMEKWELPAPGEDGRISFELPFTLTRGNAVGMMAFFRQFLLNHTEATSPDFNCRNLKLSQTPPPDDALVITCDMWLAPYDLDVAQHMMMKIIPTENAGVFAVVLELARMSGTEEAWLRTNYGYLNLVRHQFLIWRNLDDKARVSYIEQGSKLFQKKND